MIDSQKLALRIAEKLREIATRQGNVPFDTGDLRKSHVVEPHGADGALLAANTPYARAVHDGRPKLVLKSKKGTAFAQPARKGNPWLMRAVEELEAEGLDFLAPDIGEAVAADLTRALRAGGLTMRKTSAGSKRRSRQ